MGQMYFRLDKEHLFRSLWNFQLNENVDCGARVVSGMWKR